ncbi:MAG: hypothetical protein IT353_09280 [Gemmatimonadaceae bacterium]|nr:hypothetical protein [Gemmatimonadaceae bacterium]
MRSIGFRAAPTQVTYAIVEGDGSTFTIITLGNLPVPAALLPPNQLHFLRTVLLDVMRAFQIVRAGLRLPEMTPGGADSFRTNAEGVLQELLASSQVQWYFTGRKDRIASLLTIERKAVSRLMDGDEAPPYATDWASYDKATREAILAACAAIAGAPGVLDAHVLAGIGGRV